MDKLEIYLDDLKKEKQIEVLEFYNIEVPEDMGLELIPLFELERR